MVADIYIIYISSIFFKKVTNRSDGSSWAIIGLVGIFGEHIAHLL